MDRFLPYEFCLPTADIAEYNNPHKLLYHLVHNRLNTARDMEQLRCTASAINSCELAIAIDEYHADGRNHYYKVSSSILPALLHSKIGKINLSGFKLPYPMMEIRFPEGNNICTNEDSELRSMIIWDRMAECLFKKNSAGETVIVRNNARQFVIASQWRSIRTQSIVSTARNITTNLVIKNNNHICYMSDDGTINDGIKRILKIHDTKDFIYWTDENDGLSNRVSVAFAVALLASGRHRYLEPDVLSVHRKKYLNNSTTKQEREKMVAEAKDKKVNGSLFGFRYTVTPNQQKNQNTDELLDNDQPKRELAYSHWRSGHIRRIPCGEIIWIEPLIVRADLPPDPRKRQYVVKV